MKELGAVTAYFNPCGYRSKRSNYDKFRDRIGPVDLLTVECVHNADEPELGGENVLVVRGGSILWQRERLIQIGIDSLLRQGYQKIVWLDADLEFEDHHWPERVSDSLDRYTAVQCYSRCTRNFTDQTIQEHSSVWKLKNGMDIGTESSGLAWGFRADFLKAIPLYQHCIIGSGDRAAVFAFLSRSKEVHKTLRDYAHFSYFRNQPKALLDHWQRWAEACAALLDGDIGFVDQRLKAYTHGSFTLRNYGERHHLIHDYIPEADIEADSGKPWRWSSNKPELHKRVANYFYQRREDD